MLRDVLSTGLRSKASTTDGISRSIYLGAVSNSRQEVNIEVDAVECSASLIFLVLTVSPYPSIASYFKSNAAQSIHSPYSNVGGAIVKSNNSLKYSQIVHSLIHPGCHSEICPFGSSKGLSTLR